jgi:acetyl esterase/lipase
MINRRSFIAASAVVPTFAFAHHAAAQEATPTATSTELDVAFGEADGVQLLLDVYRPASTEGPNPAVILLYPGGLMAGDKSWMADAGIGLAQAGYVAFSINYRLFDGGVKNLWPVQLDDAQRAVRWIKANAAAYGVDPARVASYGHSSGAQLAAFLGTRDTRDDSDSALAGISSRVVCVVDMAGGMDMTIPTGSAEVDAGRVGILGGTSDSPPDLAAWHDFSPITFVDETTAPFLILQGGADSDVNITNSRLMETKLRETGIEVVYAEFPTYDHFAWDWAHASTWALAFFGEQLAPKS